MFDFIAYDVGNWDIHLMLNINALYRKGVTKVVFKLSGLIGPNDPSVSFARAYVFYCVLTDHLFDAYLYLYRLKTSCFQPVLCQPLILVPVPFFVTLQSL
jgi:hypothetical protein